MADHRAEPLLCPRCGSPVDSMPTCHTWPRRRDDGTEQWMSCLPCDSATDWYCTSDECRWGWTQGLNPRNPRAADNESRRPEWAVQQ
jgi:hypothetical protein